MKEPRGSGRDRRWAPRMDLIAVVPAEEKEVLLAGQDEEKTNMRMKRDSRSHLTVNQT